MSKFIVGTANFGQEYGVANRGKSLSNNELNELIKWSQENGMNHFDTAQTYGDAQKILGSFLDFSLKPDVDSKLDERSCRSQKDILKMAEDIKKSLSIEQISTLYLHSEVALKSGSTKEISAGLKEILELGIAKRVGISIYTEDAILYCKKAIPELSVFQVPENICDRRLITSRTIQRLSDEGVIFNVRSIFLQGLLLNPTSLPHRLQSASTKLQELILFAEKNSMSVLELCVAYAKSIPWARGIIVGAASLDQLKEIHKVSSLLPEGWENSIPILPEDVVDPRKW
jgi:aryl-alcohol dehydrogenase-like predicted oxidoreductase